MLNHKFLILFTLLIAGVFTQDFLPKDLNTNPIETKFLEPQNTKTESEYDYKILDIFTGKEILFKYNTSAKNALLQEEIEFFAEKNRKIELLNEQATNSLIDYDMYVFSIQWGPSLCQKNADCQKKLGIIPKNIFTLHGLWPGFASGKRIDKCNAGKDINVVQDSSDIFKQMNIFWLSLQGPNEHFWNHEYNTHGYCYTQKYSKSSDPKAFFKFSMDLYNKHDLENLMIKAMQITQGEKEFKYEELKTKLRTVGDLTGLKFDLNCKRYSGKQYLEEVRLYFDLDLQPMASGIHADDCDKSLSVYVNFL